MFIRIVGLWKSYNVWFIYRLAEVEIWYLEFTIFRRLDFHTICFENWISTLSISNGVSKCFGVIAPILYPGLYIIYRRVEGKLEEKLNIENRDEIFCELYSVSLTLSFFLHLKYPVFCRSVCVIIARKKKFVKCYTCGRYVCMCVCMYEVK